MSGPLISVIMPVYNAAGTLHRALRSVLRQTLTDFELILVDDCSTDESADILRSYQALDNRVRIFSTTKNSGPGVARNVGLKNARGRYIAFLDSDDFWMRNKLERQVRIFDNDEVILSYTATVLLNQRGDILGILKGQRKLYLRDMKFANRVTLSSATFRSKLNGAEKMPSIRSRQDYAYWIALLRKNHGYISGVPDTLVGYVKMPGSVSSNAWRNVVDTHRMYVSEVGVSGVQAAMLVMVFACFKCQKEVAARFRWICLSREKKVKLRTSIDLYWNWDEQGKKP